MSKFTIHQQYIALKDSRQNLQLEYFSPNYSGELNYEYRKGAIDRLKEADKSLDFLRYHAPDFNEYLAMKIDQGWVTDQTNTGGAS